MRGFLHALRAKESDLQGNQFELHENKHYGGTGFTYFYNECSCA